LCLLPFISLAVNVSVGCPEKNKKENRKFAKQVEKARACTRSLSQNRKSITEKLALCHFPLFFVK